MSKLDNRLNHRQLSCLTIDVEDWFHILDSSATPSIERWSSLESRIERNLERLLTLLDTYSVKVTFFWLGWLAEQHKNLVRRCQNAGHEIASHGYAHVLAYEVGEKAFRQDITRAKAVLEDIIGEAVRGFRAPGFSITKEAVWAFDVIAESGYQYDSSIFPTLRGHGGMSDSPLGLYFIKTRSDHLLEIPMSIIEILGSRKSLFGGGYLRLANKLMINWGIHRLHTTGLPLIVYVHPREIDSGQPHLSLTLMRRFKYYVKLNSTLPKLKWLCKNYSFCTMLEMVEGYVRSFYLERRIIPVVRFRGSQVAIERLPALEVLTPPANREAFRTRLLLVEKAMADFLSPRISAHTKQRRNTANAIL